MINSLVSVDPDVHYFNGQSGECECFSLASYQNLELQQTGPKVSFLNFNIRSFHANAHLFESFLGSVSRSFDFIVVTETWNTPIIADCCNIDNYSSFHTYRNNVPRRGGVGGGVSIFCNKKYNFVSKVESLSVCTSDIETCVVAIEQNQSEKIIIIGVYRPPSGCEQNFRNELEDILTNELVNVSSNLVLFLGDFNSNCLANSGEFLNLESLMRSYHFTQTICKPTRYPPNDNIGSPSILDHIWVNRIQNWKSGVILLDISDHCPNFLFLDAPTPLDQKQKIEFRPFSELNMEKFLDDLSSVDWNVVLNFEYVDESWNKFIDIIDQKYCLHFPKKTKYISSKRLKKPWLSRYVLGLIKRKSEYFRLFKMGILSRECNNSFRNRVNSIVKKAKDDYHNNLFSNNENSNQCWKTINKLMGRDKQSNPIGKMVFDNETFDSLQVVLNKFNNYFATIADILNTNLPVAGRSALSYMNIE